jgi:hypothetical protein
VRDTPRVSHLTQPPSDGASTIPRMDERRRITAMILLFAIGFALIALASAISDVWPLFLTPLPYAAIAWIVVRADDDTMTTTDDVTS